MKVSLFFRSFSPFLLVGSFANNAVPSNDQVAIEEFLNSDGSINFGMTDHGKDPLFKQPIVSNSDLTANDMEIKETGAVNKLSEKRLQRLRLGSNAKHKAHHFIIDVTEQANDDPIMEAKSSNHGIRGSEVDHEAINSKSAKDQRDLHFIHHHHHLHHHHHHHHHLHHHHHHTEPASNFVEDHGAMVDRSFELPRLRYHEFSMPNSTPEGY